MFTLASALTKLTTAVESKVRFENAPTNLNDRELLQLATEHDPGLLDPFTEYLLKAVNQNNYAIVLICSNDSMKALLEDAGCTSKNGYALVERSAGQTLRDISKPVCY